MSGHTKTPVDAVKKAQIATLLRYLHSKEAMGVVRQVEIVTDKSEMWYYVGGVAPTLWKKVIRPELGRIATLRGIHEERMLSVELPGDVFVEAPWVSFYLGEN